MVLQCCVTQERFVGSAFGGCARWRQNTRDALMRQTYIFTHRHTDTDNIKKTQQQQQKRILFFLMRLVWRWLVLVLAWAGHGR